MNLGVCGWLCVVWWEVGVSRSGILCCVAGLFLTSSGVGEFSGFGVRGTATVVGCVSCSTVSALWVGFAGLLAVFCWMVACAFDAPRRGTRSLLNCCRNPGSCGTRMGLIFGKILLLFWDKITRLDKIFLWRYRRIELPDRGIDLSAVPNLLMILILKFNSSNSDYTASIATRVRTRLITTLRCLSFCKL